MTYGTRTDHYPATSKLLHWLVAACVLMTAPVAIAMTRIDKGPTQDTLYNLHKSLGVLILILMVLRLINRLAAGAGPRGGNQALAKDRFIDRAHFALCSVAGDAGCRLHRQFRLRRHHTFLRAVRATRNRRQERRACNTAVHAPPVGGVARNSTGSDACQRGALPSLHPPRRCSEAHAAACDGRILIQ